MANQIKTFGMSRMTIGSCSDFHTKVNDCITATTPAALHITEKATAYSAASELLASIVNRERAGGHVFVDCGQRIERRLRIGRRHACAGTGSVTDFSDKTQIHADFRRLFSIFQSA